MYQLGHYGVSLAVFSPVGFALLRLGRPELAFLTGAAMLGLAMLPDVDHRIPFLDHRGPTHSLPFAAAVGGAFAGVGHLLADAGSEVGVALAVGVGGVSVGLPAFGFFVGVLTVVAHLLADVLTPMGVNFLWPLSSRRYSLSLWPAKSRIANYGLFAAGVFVASATFLLAVRV
ncbi:metal-dependent hydrolase [Halopelagius longus]|uniref:Inner membrane protein n=1 Tax=Halopelagius longus TaxID=1236180 RepID=A0A1H1BD75_9EURY|nr:metal-dependent hydrolase [Halopelagius longus]RDI70743.1 metal-dependent hydrolase [Halopelagius longus]SDQ49879.1 inner membrane protein [Halopelagius longus]